MVHVSLESKLSFGQSRSRHQVSSNLYRVIINGEDGEYYEYDWSWFVLWNMSQRASTISAMQNLWLNWKQISPMDTSLWEKRRRRVSSVSLVVCWSLSTSFKPLTSLREKNFWVTSPPRVLSRIWQISTQTGTSDKEQKDCGGLWLSDSVLGWVVDWKVTSG